jgi:hypothetical protein
LFSSIYGKIHGMNVKIIHFTMSLIILFSFVGCRERNSRQINNEPPIAPLEISTPEPYEDPSRFAYANVGDIIQFGNYEWRVLEVQDGRALIITDKIIESRTFHNTWEPNITWADSDLRAFLNGEFLNRFSTTDRARIIQVTNSNPNNQWFGTPGGPATQDRIFLLDFDEVVRYFGDSGQLARRPGPGAWWIEDQYNEVRIAYHAGQVFDGWEITSGDPSRWWLRSLAHSDSGPAGVDGRGYIRTYGFGVNAFDGFGGVRPALWLNLKAVNENIIPYEEIAELRNIVDEDSIRLETDYAPNRFAYANVGDIIQFGNYEWRILEVQDGRALIITDRVIESRTYHNTWETNITWADSDIRAFLNSEFLNRFSTTDKARIIQVTNTTPNNPWFGTIGGAATQDRIFLLSIDEVVRYFGDSGRLANRLTHGAGTNWINDRYNEVRIANHAGQAFDGWKITSGDPSRWWLRSQGFSGSGPAGVDGGGFIRLYGFGQNAFDGFGGVRPALWLNIMLSSNE